ncbi:hypothetical protein CEP54_010012 [Fusarium duplospermum]|uniref:Uncharacterized protein n=1 Tax=Fusarium duplospermum TaxID=1325734 RepID=A0A428PMJ1_9HYPO|nr:hypothetical protein CEP54_010012 [Fusarium duplospermum]
MLIIVALGSTNKASIALSSFQKTLIGSIFSLVRSRLSHSDLGSRTFLAVQNPGSLEICAKFLRAIFSVGYPGFNYDKEHISNTS